MNKHIQPLHKIVAVGFAFVAFSAAAQNCPTNIPSATYTCNGHNTPHNTVYSSFNNTDLTIDGSTHTPPATPLTISTYTGAGWNGIAIYNRSPYIETAKLTTEGYVNISAPLRTGRGSVPDAILIRANKATVELSENTTIETDQGPRFLDAADGVVIETSRRATDSTIDITSQANITTKKPNSNGIIAKYAKTIDIKINQKGQITTEQTNSPAINSNPGGWPANSTVTLTNAKIITKGSKSVGVVYNPPFFIFGGEESSTAKTSTIIAKNSTITTKEKEAHGIAAAAGFGDDPATVNNTVALTNSTLALSGSKAHGVYLSTGRGKRAATTGGLYKGKPTARVTMKGGSITSTLGDGIHFVDSLKTNPTPVDQGTTGSVTLSDSAATGSAGWATIDAPSGNAIFTARGSDRVTLKNNTRIRGMVDGGDDAASLPDRWVDVLTFDDYDSTQQLAYTNALVQYQNFEAVKLINNTVIQFPADYNTPQSETYQIDDSSAVTAHNNTTGTTSNYIINASLTNHGIVNLQDGAKGDTLTVTGNANGNGKFLFDINATTGKADTLTIDGDYSGTFTVELNDVVPTADATKIIDLVIVKGTNSGSVTLTTRSTHAVGGVTYSLFSYKKNGENIWALKALSPTPAAKIPTLSAYGLLLLLLSMCLTVTRYFRNH